MHLCLTLVHGPATLVYFCQVEFETEHCFRGKYCTSRFLLLFISHLHHCKRTLLYYCTMPILVLLPQGNFSSYTCCYTMDYSECIWEVWYESQKSKGGIFYCLRNGFLLSTHGPEWLEYTTPQEFKGRPHLFVICYWSYGYSGKTKILYHYIVQFKTCD